MAESEGKGRKPQGNEPVMPKAFADTDEQFQDHPEFAPTQGTPGMERVKRFDSMSIRRRANTGDIVDDAGDRHFKLELDFSRNHDFAGDQGALTTDADESRGSGFLGGKLHGNYESSGEVEPEGGFSSQGFPYSDSQARNIEAIQREERQDRESREALSHSGWDSDSAPHIEGLYRGYPSRENSIQGSDYRMQATGTQAFGRDVGTSGLSQTDREEHAYSAGMGNPSRLSEEAMAKAAALRRLGGSSPGSEENLQLLEKFGKVKFPSYKSEVLHCLTPGAELRTREGMSVSLRDAVIHSRIQVFRNLNDLIDSVKDELRRVEMSAHA